MVVKMLFGCSHHKRESRFASQRPDQTLHAVLGATLRLQQRSAYSRSGFLRLLHTQAQACNALSCETPRGCATYSAKCESSHVVECFTRRCTDKRLPVSSFTSKVGTSSTRRTKKNTQSLVQKRTPTPGANEDEELSVLCSWTKL